MIGSVFRHFSSVLLSNSLLLLFCAKGDASKSGSEINLCAQSMEDVDGSKKDLSASSGASDILLVLVYTHMCCMGVSALVMEEWKGLKHNILRIVKTLLQSQCPHSRIMLNSIYTISHPHLFTQRECYVPCGSNTVYCLPVIPSIFPM